jgi:hypothetical protein
MRKPDDRSKRITNLQGYCLLRPEFSLEDDLSSAELGSGVHSGRLHDFCFSSMSRRYASCAAKLIISRSLARMLWVDFHSLPSRYVPSPPRSGEKVPDRADEGDSGVHDVRPKAPSPWPSPPSRLRQPCLLTPHEHAQTARGRGDKTAGSSPGFSQIATCTELVADVGKLREIRGVLDDSDIGYLTLLTGPETASLPMRLFVMDPVGQSFEYCVSPVLKQNRRSGASSCLNPGVECPACKSRFDNARSCRTNSNSETVWRRAARSRQLDRLKDRSTNNCLHFIPLTQRR